MSGQNTGTAGAANSTAQQTGTGEQQQQTSGQPKAGETGSGSGDAGKTGGESGKTGETPAGGDAGKTGETPAEQKTGDQGKTDDGGKAGGSKEQSKAPDKYELSIPDAVKPLVDGDVLKQFEATARTQGMTNEEAQAFLEDSLAHVSRQSEAWAKETKEHPVYGGDKLEETQRYAKKAVDRVFPEGHAMRSSFLAFMSRGGAGNNINAVAFLAEVGRMMSEDTGAGHSRGARGAAAGATAEEKASKLYDHPDSKKAETAAG